MNQREDRKQYRNKEIMMKIGREIDEHNKADYEKMVAWTMWRFGVARRTAREYIDPLFVLDIFTKEDRWIYGTKKKAQTTLDQESGGST